MPRENRKRGKKHKKEAAEPEQPHHSQAPPPAQETSQPSWILSSSKQTEEINPEAPYGYIDADVKAYFRTVDVQIREWQESRGYHDKDDGKEEEGGDVDPNEERRLFFVAALTEMQGKEKQMATDPDCSVILERMFYSMDDFVRRVFVDSLAGSYGTLVKHRFASHVCQTLFSVARDTVSRETKGVVPSVPDSPDKGELRTLTQLILDVSEELLPTFPSLIMDPFASHVMRSLLLLLSPTLSSSTSSSEDNLSAVRSKKSAAWKAKQGPMKSVFSNDIEKGKGKFIPLKSAPSEFRKMARRFVQVLRDQLGENEVRAMAASKVAGPGLRVFLEVEADQSMANEPGSLMDRVMVGLITSCRNDPSSTPDASDYLGTLLRDPSSSHILEIITSRCPPSAFDKLWAIYFKGALPRLAVHPVANFVFAKALERVSECQLLEVCAELRNTWPKLIGTSRTGVLRAAIDRAAVLQALGEEIVEATYLAFNLESAEDRLLLVPCVLTLLPLQDYKTALASGPTHQDEQQQNYHRGRPLPPSQSPLTPKIQGSVLLQSFIRLPEPHNQPVLNSIHSIPIDDRIKIAHDSSASRVYDVLLDSPTVPLAAKRQFVMDFMGHYHLLVDDRIGSRVGDRCWGFADTYLKEKIARSLIPHDQTLAASFYGKFFARNLNLYLLQRRPDEWRNAQSEKKKTSLPSQGVEKEETQIKIKEEPKKRKRKPAENEIDELFDAALGRKIKKAALATIPVSEEKEEVVVKGKKEEDKSLKAVLGAIRSAPKGEEKHGKKRKKV